MTLIIYANKKQLEKIKHDLNFLKKEEVNEKE